MKTTLALLSLMACAALAAADDLSLHFSGGDGPGKGHKIVLVSGDEEYRSEESLPELAKILSSRHGFDCTVCFAYNDRTGNVDPTYNKNIPGLEALDDADLMIILTRYRDLPDAQMEHIDNFLMAGKPVIGIRTATHAFKPSDDSKWVHYGDGYAGDKKEWIDGFGRVVLGEKWIAHHGDHKNESTRGRFAPGAAQSPILKGIADGDIWGPTDVYAVRLPLPGDSTPLVLGEVTKRDGPADMNDRLYGMRPEDKTPVEGAKNNPMMPIAWTHSYQLPGGKPGKAFASTIGSSTDLLNEGVRRMFVNAAYVLTGLGDKIPDGGTNVDLVGDYTPTKFEFRAGKEWRDKHLQPADFGK